MIIDPKIFYWINAISNIQVACLSIGIILGIAFFIFFAFTIYYKSEEYCEDDEDDNKTLNSLIKVIRWTFIGFLVCTIFAIFIPDETTLTKMLIAKNITYDFLESGTEAAKELVDYIINAIKSI